MCMQAASFASPAPQPGPGHGTRRARPSRARRSRRPARAPPPPPAAASPNRAVSRCRRRAVSCTRLGHCGSALGSPSPADGLLAAAAEHAVLVADQLLLQLGCDLARGLAQRRDLHLQSSVLLPQLRLWRARRGRRVEELVVAALTVGLRRHRPAGLAAAAEPGDPRRPYLFALRHRAVLLPGSTLARSRLAVLIFVARAHHDAPGEQCPLPRENRTAPATSSAAACGRLVQYAALLAQDDL